MNEIKLTLNQIENLKEELRKVRVASLNATRQGEYLKVAKLTVQAANINKNILEAEGMLMALEA